MDDLQLIQFLTQSLVQAAQQQNWPRIQQIDGNIAQMLQSLSHHPLTEKKLRALKQLQAVHQQVYSLCREEHRTLEKKMAVFQQTREGLSAYETFVQDEGR